MPASENARAPIVAYRPGAVPSKAPELFKLSVEEHEALVFWRLRTSRWLANYSSHEQRVAWEIVLPRCAMQLEATRHLMVAIAMMDKPVAAFTSDLLTQRSHKVLHYYNLAIQRLTMGQPPSLDVSMATILAWVLEVMIGDQTKARMHLDASKSFLERLSQNRLCGEAQDILEQHVGPVRGECYAFLASREGLKAEQRDSVSVLNFVVVNNRPPTLSTPREAREALEQSFLQLRYLITAGRQTEIDNLHQSLHYYKHESLKFRFDSSGGAINAAAVHLMYNLLVTLLPKAPNQEPLEEANPESVAIGYILDRSGDLLASQGMTSSDRTELETTLDIVLINIMQFASNEEQRMHALRLRQSHRLQCETTFP